MSKSLDQSAAAAIVPDESPTNSQAQPEAVAKAKLPEADKSTLAECEKAQDGQARQTGGWPVPVVSTAKAEPSTDVVTTSASSPHMGQAVPPRDAEPASALRASAAEAPLRAFQIRNFPPRKKNVWSSLDGILLKVAALAVAVGVGWIAGANTFDRTEEVRRLALGLHDTDAKLADVAKRTARVAPAVDLAPLKGDIAALRKTVDGLGKGLDSQKGGLGAAKATLDATKTAADTAKAGLNSTRGDIESIKSGLQAAQADLAASKSATSKIDRLAERIDRLEHQVSSSLPTGSIPPASATPASPGGQASPNAGKDPHPQPGKEPRATLGKPKMPPNGYVLRDVQDGVALVEDQNGLHEVVPGEVLAGIGRVESIERRGHRWVVVTSDGLIDSEPY